MTERERYAEIYGQSREVTPVNRAAFRRVWQQHWGDELAYALAPTNFITWAELHRIAAELRIGAGARLVDLGCGRGGPGLWLAEKAGATLIGIDFSPAACDAARAQAATAAFAGVAAEFRLADMTATGLADASFDAALSIDAVQIVRRRADAFAEAARLLRPGARYVLTTFDHPGDLPPGALMPGREAVPDSRPLLEAAGFRVRAYDRLESWDRRAAATYRDLLGQPEIVAAVAGAALLREAEWGAASAQHSVHMFIVAERVG